MSLPYKYLKGIPCRFAEISMVNSYLFWMVVIWIIIMLIVIIWIIIWIYRSNLNLQQQKKGQVTRLLAQELQDRFDLSGDVFHCHVWLSEGKPCNTYIYITWFIHTCNIYIYTHYIWFIHTLLIHILPCYIYMYIHTCMTIVKNCSLQHSNNAT